MFFQIGKAVAYVYITVRGSFPDQGLPLRKGHKARRIRGFAGQNILQV